MVAFKISSFSGMVPAVDDRLLGDTNAARSENTFLYSGALTGLPVLEQVRECTGSSIAKVHRLPESYSNPTFVPRSTWLEFTNPDTDVIRAPVYNDTYDRYYFASSTEAPKYNTRARLDAGTHDWLLGIPTPGATSLSATGGSGAADTRSYVVTWVSEYGEEGPPGAPVTLVGKVDDTWTITLPTVSSSDDGDLNDNRFLSNARIYRTVVSAGGVTNYYLVAEVTVATATYDDSDSDADITENGLLESTGWTGPPSDLQGFVVMPNGIIASWRSNELWFSEPYRPHAWPVAYVQTVAFPIVGLGLVNQTLVVCTSGSPVTATGINPESISTSNLTSFEPCRSRRSILSTPEGVYYSSPNGLVLVRPGSVENITKNLITKDKWQEFTRSADLTAARFGTSYYAFGSVVFGVFESTAFESTAFEQEDFSAAYTGVLIDPHNRNVGFNLLTSDTPVLSVQNDAWSSEIYVIDDDVVYTLNQGLSTRVIGPYLWRSKVFQVLSPVNLGVAQVFFEVPTNAPAQSGARDNTTVQTLAGDQYGLLRVYAGGTLVATRELRTSGEQHRLPTGFKETFWQFEVEARVRLLSLNVASSPQELKGV